MCKNDFSVSHSLSILEKKIIHLIVLKMPDDTKASLLLRVIAKALDFIIIAAAAKIIPQVGYIAGIVYILISDGLFDGRSIGKRLLKLKVMSLPTGSSATFRDSILRNTTISVALVLYKVPLIGWLFLLSILLIEFLLMLGSKDGMRLGDDLANTKVIEEKALIVDSK